MRRASLVIITVTLAATTSLPDVTGQVTRPNVVVILVDDMRWDEAGLPSGFAQTFPAGYLPAIRALANTGFWSSNAFNVNSVCCPARASILTGNYAHTTDVWRNSPPHGGWDSFKASESSTLGTWFDATGYETGYVGKYFNGYNTISHIPHGWDRWVAFKHSTVGYYNYTLSVDGVGRSYGSSPSDYSTDALGGFAEAFIHGADPSDPLLLYFSPYAPHAPWTPAPRHAGMYSSYTPKLPPNVAEADVSDKPAWVRALKRTNGGWVDKKRKQMEMLMAVDDAVARIRAALAAEERLANTIFVFTSDNGMSGGSHRWTSKKSAWDEALRIPFIAAGPGITPGTTSDELLLNIDIADTLEQLAGVPVPATDGVSFAGLLAGGTTPIHQDFVFERLRDATVPPSYCGVRTLTHKYIRYSTGEEELYDLVADPWEMRSLHADPGSATLKAALRARTVALCDPPPPGYSF